MDRRTALFAPLVLLAFTWPAQAERISLNAISAYLNGISTAETDFTQVNSDGTLSTGRIYIRRPGRVRFEYAPPDRTLVLASGSQVAIYDSKSNQPPEQYPLRRTPLNLILAADINLAQAKMVVGHREEGNKTLVRAQDPAHPEYGTIEMVFTDKPLALRQWVITDDAGAQTTVILGEMERGKSYQPSMFSIEFETQRRQR